MCATSGHELYQHIKILGKRGVIDILIKNFVDESADVTSIRVNISELVVVSKEKYPWLRAAEDMSEYQLVQSFSWEPQDLYLEEEEMICQSNTHQRDVPKQNEATIARLVDCLPRDLLNFHRGQKARTKRPRSYKFCHHKIDRRRREAGGDRRSPVSLSEEETSTIGEDEWMCFEKESPLWIEVESMEEFRKMPQKPHYHGVESLKKCAREGEAIGLVVTFANMVKKTSNLRLDATRKDINDDLEVLEELEKNGFDIHILQDRLKQMLLLMDKQEKLDNISKETIMRINEINDVKCNTEKYISEMQKDLTALLQKLAVATSEQEEMDSDIASLESTSSEITKNINIVRKKLEALVASPL